MRVIAVENEPTPFHLRVAQFYTSAAGHLALVERQVHVFRRVAVQVVHLQLAAACWKISGRKGVGAAHGGIHSGAAWTLLAGSGADSLLVRRAVAPGFRRAVFLIVRHAHSFDRLRRGHTLGQVEAVIGGLQRSRARAFPFVRVAQAPAHGGADFRGFPGFHPHDRIGTRYIGEFKLIDAGFGVFGALLGRVIERSHVFGPADFYEHGILVVNTRLRQLGLALLRSHGMPGDDRVPLADHSGAGKDCADGLHLRVRQSMDALQLLEQDFVLLAQRRAGSQQPVQARRARKCQQP